MLSTKLLPRNKKKETQNSPNDVQKLKNVYERTEKSTIFAQKTKKIKLMLCLSLTQ